MTSQLERHMALAVRDLIGSGYVEHHYLDLAGDFVGVALGEVDRFRDALWATINEARSDPAFTVLDCLRLIADASVSGLGEGEPQ